MRAARCGADAGLCGTILGQLVLLQLVDRELQAGSVLQTSCALRRSRLTRVLALP